jgi:hypothetical protein
VKLKTADTARSYLGLLERFKATTDDLDARAEHDAWVDVLRRPRTSRGYSGTSA